MIARSNGMARYPALAFLILSPVLCLDLSADSVPRSPAAALPPPRRKVIKRAPDCRRFVALVAYDGADFCGWQAQPHQRQHGGSPTAADASADVNLAAPSAALRTVQATLEEALGTALHQDVRCWAAGRTDAGVSAMAQVVQFDAMLAQSSPTASKTGRSRLRGAARDAFDAAARDWEAGPLVVEMT